MSDSGFSQRISVYGKAGIGLKNYWLINAVIGNLKYWDWTYPVSRLTKH